MREEMKARDATALRIAPLDTPTDLRANAVLEISGALNVVLSDMFALYLKTKNFHWHMSGSHFRDYHLLLDEQSEDGETKSIPHVCRAVSGLRIGVPSGISRAEPSPNPARRGRV
jgi:starvation-inducible DNA-binding protein